MNILPLNNSVDKLGSASAQWAELNVLVVNLNGTPAAKTTRALDTFGATTDITDLDATTLKHGLMPKLDKVKLDGIETAATADQTNAEIETAYNAQVGQVSGPEITAGTATGIRRYSPADIVALIDAHAPTSLDASGVVSAISAATNATDTITKTLTTGVLTYDLRVKTSGLTSGVQGEISKDSNGAFILLGTGANVAAAGNDSRFLTADQKAAAAASDAPTSINPMMTLSGAKGIALDEFSATTDNTNLDATTLKHGLMSKTDKIIVSTIESRALDTFGATTDNTTLDATTSKHGLMPKNDKIKLDGIETAATADQTNAEIETAYNTQVSQVTSPEIVAGTATGIRRYSPADVKAFITAHAVSSGATFNTAKGSSIVSATTIDLGVTTGNIVDVTGTTTITGLGTAASGITRLVRFTDALILTHNATSLILLSGASITTAAGDIAAFSSLGSGNWHMVFYQRATGYPLAVTAPGASWDTAKGSDITSAGTINLGATTGNIVDVTGTTTITSLGTATAGISRLVRFTGALTLTHHATSLILLSGASITTAAGDIAAFSSLGSGNWHMVFYQRATGYPLIGSFNAAIPGAIGGTTPAAGTFTALTASTSLNIPSYTRGTLPSAATAGRAILIADGFGSGGGAWNYELATSNGMVWQYAHSGATVA
jgi:hypothetical protein